MLLANMLSTRASLPQKKLFLTLLKLKHMNSYMNLLKFKFQDKTFRCFDFPASMESTHRTKTISSFGGKLQRIFPVFYLNDQKYTFIARIHNGESSSTT